MLIWLNPKITVIAVHSRESRTDRVKYDSFIMSNEENTDRSQPGDANMELGGL